MKKENKQIDAFTIIAIILIIGALVISCYIIVQENKEQERVKEVEVCEGVTIATMNANPDLCFFGCIQYKGEFVSYDTLKYLEELCEKQNKSSE